MFRSLTFTHSKVRDQLLRKLQVPLKVGTGTDTGTRSITIELIIQTSFVTNINAWMLHYSSIVWGHDISISP